MICIRTFFDAVFSLRGLASGALFIASCSSFYWLAKLLIAKRPKRELSIALDDRIPFVPAAAIPYLSSFVFWIATCAYLSALDVTRYHRFLASGIMGAMISCVFFVAIPSEIKPPPVPKGFLGFFIGAIQFVDNPPVNLFPSIHCMASLLSVLAALGVTPAPWVAVSVIWAALIVLSTVLVKQHYAIDTVAGLALAAVCWAACSGGVFVRLAEILSGWLFSIPFLR